MTITARKLALEFAVARRPRTDADRQAMARIWTQVATRVDDDRQSARSRSSIPA